MSVNVFEKGCSKWVAMDGMNVHYVSDKAKATKFDMQGLVAASQLIDFVIYKRTMIAVPCATNMEWWDCNTVSLYLADRKDVSDYQTHGYGE